MKRVFIAALCFLLFISSGALSRKAQKSSKPDDMQVQVDKGSVLDMDRPLDMVGFHSTAQTDTFLLGEWTFDSEFFCTAEGWEAIDLSVWDFGICYWHIADSTELDGGNYNNLVVLDGDQSLWCGVTPDPLDEVLCGYGSLPGYGNSWNQSWCFKCIEVPDTEEIYIDYLIAYDSEPGYDYTYVEYVTRSTCDSLAHPDIIPPDSWNILAAYDDFGNTSGSDTIPAGHGEMVKIRFHFVSDGAWSDQDGLWDTDGASIIDNLTVTAENSGLIDFEDFEYNAGEGGENPGDTQTADGDWECCNLSGYGDFSGLYYGTSLVQEDPCKRNISCLWAFINGSDANYSCGGHPEQTAVPYENEQGQFINNWIQSPKMDWVGSGSQVVLEFDVYRDLQLNALMFYNWGVRSIGSTGCPGGWRDRTCCYYGGGKDWFRAEQWVGDLISPGAEQIQVMLGVFDMCRFWCITYGTGECHSHAPLFDNVKVYRVANTGPTWSVRDIDLFNDTFPENGTSVGTGRIDMALDRLWSSNPGILPGDSAKVRVNDPEAGLDGDFYTGFGPSVYFYMRRDPASKPIATTKVEEDAFRWPLVDSVLAGGDQWYMFRMDTCFAQPSRRGPVPDGFCIDLNDHYFTNGDTILFFFGAHNASNEWTWWTQLTGTVDNIEEAARYLPSVDGRYHNAMEMQILPGAGVANGGDFLYVDNFSGRGAQPYFDSAFLMMGIFDQVDRFDKRGPSSLVGNALGYHASLAQLHGSYRNIMWNSGDLSVGTVGDGTDEKADDYALLYAFLDQHPDPNGAGIYFSGDDLAQELDEMTSPSSLQFRGKYMPHVLVTGDHASLHRVSPMAIGEATGTGSPPSYGIFDHGPPIGVDTIYAFGGCPTINDFDVIDPIGSSTLEMCYDPVDPSDDSNPAVIAFDTVNSVGNRAATVLSGFSYHYIRDDRPQGRPDRADHLVDILQYLGDALPMPSTVKPGMHYSNSLAQNYPNPFNPSTTIKYSLKSNAHVSLKIYNVAGQLVRTLVNSDMIAGAYKETWNGRSNTGNPVSSGVYFYKLVTKNFSMTKKMVVLK